jgi:pre-rRNA-processing protein TSR3
MKLQVLMFYQDDPKKCTAAKMVKFGLAQNIKKIGSKGLVLDPFSEKTLLPKDKSVINSIIGIDCSWNLADQAFSKKFAGIKRKLPPLLAGNPVNYSKLNKLTTVEKLNKLTTVEALSASLFILGSKEQALELLDKFKWGHTFYELNQNLLDEYSKLEDESQIELILKDYGLI